MTTDLPNPTSTEKTHSFFFNLFPLSFIGISFFGLHAGYTYAFFHVNSYKLFFLGICVTVMTLAAFFRKTEPVIQLNGLKLIGLLSLPLLVTLPGAFANGMVYNYYFPIEFSGKVFLILWSYFLFTDCAAKDSTAAIVKWLGYTLIFVCLYAVLEKFKINPFEAGFLGPGTSNRVKSTFGNINYFAGFLAVIMPFLMISFFGNSTFGNMASEMPHTENREGFWNTLKNRLAAPVKNHPYQLIVVLLGLTALILTETRAAQAAFVIGSVTLGGLYILTTLPPATKKLFYVLIVLGFFGGLAALYIAFIYNETLIAVFGQDNRYIALLRPEAWYNRLGSWVTAWHSIMAGPFIGFGLGSSYALFFDFVPEQHDLYSSEKSFNHVHNEHLEFLQEGGFIGYTVFLLVVGFFVVKLFRLAVDKSVTQHHRMAALGCAAGILVFYIHGLFSVAQRMIVTNSALYTLLGLGFFLMVRHGHLSGKVFGFIKASHIPVRKPAVIYAGLFLPLLAVSWGLFYSWSKPLIEKNIYASKPNKSLVDFIRFAETAKQNPSVYVLHDLMYQEMRVKRYDDALQTGKILLETIPHYRNVDYLTAQAAFFSGRNDEAKNYLDLAKVRGRYNWEVNIFQIYLALINDDRSSFEEAISSLLIKNVFQTMYPIKKPENITVSFNYPPTDGDLIVFQPTKNGIPVDYKNSGDQLCGLKAEAVDTVNLAVSSALYDDFRAVVTGPTFSFQTDVFEFHRNVSRIMNAIIADFELVFCPTLSQAEKDNVTRIVKEIGLQKSTLTALEERNEAVKTNRLNMSLEEHQKLSADITAANQKLTSLRNDIQGKSNYFFSANDITALLFINSVANAVFRFRVNAESNG